VQAAAQPIDTNWQKDKRVLVNILRRCASNRDLERPIADYSEWNVMYCDAQRLMQNIMQLSDGPEDYAVKTILLQSLESQSFRMAKLWMAHQAISSS
jgi:hypothetical protein